jgi:uncharacterized protein HemX
MKKQSGVSGVGIVLAIVVLGAAGGGYLGWQQHQELARTKTELASTRSALDKANADARAARADAAAARKAFEDQTAALEQARSERDSAKAFLENEKTHAARLQAELGLAREQLAYMRARGSPAQYSQPPTVVRPRPMVIQALPAPRPQGAASPAQ